MGKAGEDVPAEYRMVGGPGGIQGMRHLECNRITYHPDDVNRRFCPFCNRHLKPRPEDEHAPSR